MAGQILTIVNSVSSFFRLLSLDWVIHVSSSEMAELSQSFLLLLTTRAATQEQNAMEEKKKKKPLIFPPQSWREKGTHSV